ncbi:MAG: hypothetical protein DWQ04_03355 [Chloroflexi bacterium]|nr:MAG: hypothetical protein DWQ04_03355 [Chloroflexota bacterium]
MLLSSFAFDSTVAGIFWTLLQGGKLVLPAPGDEKDVAQLAKLVEKEQVSHTLALPSLYRLLLAYAPAGRLDSLRVAIVAGEACPPDLSVEHYGRLPHAALVNEYGPTDATVWCTSYHFPRVMDGTATSAALSAGLHANHLETALNQLVQHHAALRMVFHRTVMGWSVGVETAVSAQLQRISLAQQLPAEQDTAMMEKATQLQNTFDLAASPLLRAALFDLGPSRPPRLLLIVHHLVVDAVSWRILLADLEHAYQQVVIGQPVELPKPLTSLAQWSQHLSKFAQDRQFQQERDYWLQTAPSTMTFLSAGNSKIENTEANAAFVTAELDAVYTNALLREMHQAYHTKIDDVLLTALLHTTHEWTGRRDLLLSLERHGREEVDSQLDVSQTVGWFTSLFPTTLTLAESDDLGDSLQQVKSHLHSIPQQGIGYGVLRYLADDETRQQLAALPQPEILFNYLGQVDSLGAGSLFRPIHADVGPGYGLENRRAHVLDVNARVENGRFPNPQSPPPRQQHGIPPAGYVA